MNTQHAARPFKLTMGAHIVMLAMAQQALAFGVVQSVTGNAAVVNTDGATKTLVEGSRVEATDTVVTAAKSEVLIKTDDDGLVALKENTKFYVQEYRAKGNNQDLFVVRLIKGAFRGVTGFVGKTAPKRYRLHTPTSTIGIRGTDYQAEIVEGNGAAGTEQGASQGTYAKVNSGEISLENRGVSVNVKAQQYAFAGPSTPPQMLTNPPAGLFKPSKVDEQVDALTKNDAEQKTLQAKQAALAEDAGNVASGEIKIPKNCSGNNQAQETLNQFIQAYERGDVAFIQRRLDPNMVGYGQFLNGIMEDMNAQKQIRFLIQNRNVQCGTDLAVINFYWEKRYLDLNTFEPRLETGQSAVLTYLKGGEWRLSGITGANPFVSNLNANESLNVSAVLGVSPALVSVTQCQPNATSTFSGQVVASTPINVNTYSGGCLVGDATTTVYPIGVPAPTCSINGISGTLSSVPITTANCSTAPSYIMAMSQPTTPATGSTSYTSSPGVPGSPVPTIVVTGIPLAVVASFTAQAASSVNIIPSTVTVNTTGTCTVTGAVYPAGATSCAIPTTPTTISPFSLKLINPNQAKAGAVMVQATTSNTGDSEMLNLTETTPGTFVLSTLQVTGATASQNNGVVSVVSGTEITFKHTDPKTGKITTTTFTVQ